MTKHTYTVMPFLLVLYTALAAMPTNVFQICQRNVGTLAVEPWRLRATSWARGVMRNVQQWFSWVAGLWSPGFAFAALAVLLIVLAAHQSTAAPHGMMLAFPAIALPQLRTNRATLLREAEALRQADGTFKDDAARAAFDAKMTEVEAIDAQIRAADANPNPPAPEPAPAPAPVVDAATRQQILTDERARVTGIRDAVRVAGFDAAIATDMETRGLTLDAARAEIFAKLAERSRAAGRTDPTIEIGQDAHDKFIRGATNWLLIKSGVASLVARATKTELSTIDPGEFRGLSLIELARMTLEQAGRQVRGWDKQKLVSEAFMQRASQSTSDFAVLLENVMGKVLQAAYAIQPDTWTKFCAQSTVSDFRAHNRYRMGTFSSLDAITEDGEFKQKIVTDAEKNSIQASTKGNIVAVSRQMIVNDDLGAFTRVLSMLGRAAALSVEVDVYALLAQNAGLGPTMGDGNTLFHANHGNIGVGAAITAAALDADRVLMASQKDKDANDFIDLRPAVLVLPVGLGGTAKVINQSQYDPDTVANKSQMKPNIVVGLFREIVDTPRITGTRRYLFADPGIAPTLEVAYLEGQTAPVMETKDGWRTDGAEMKVRFDYGVAAVDFRGAETNAGA